MKALRLIWRFASPIIILLLMVLCSASVRACYKKARIADFYEAAEQVMNSPRVHSLVVPVEAMIEEAWLGIDFPEPDESTQIRTDHDLSQAGMTGKVCTTRDACQPLPLALQGFATNTYAYDALADTANGTGDISCSKAKVLKDMIDDRADYCSFDDGAYTMTYTGPLSPRVLTYYLLMRPENERRHRVIDRCNLSGSSNVIPIVLGHLLTEPDMQVRTACVRALNSMLGKGQPACDKGCWTNWLSTNADAFVIDLNRDEIFEAKGEIDTIRHRAQKGARAAKELPPERLLAYISDLERKIEEGHLNACYLWGLTGLIVETDRASSVMRYEELTHPVMMLIDLATKRIPVPADLYTTNYPVLALDNDH